MTKFIYLTLLTLKEISGQRIYQLLAAMLTIAPWLMLIPASLFMLDIGKVFIDLLFLSLHGWLLVYLFFIATPLLARDIEQGTSHIFLTLPMSRGQYYWARFTGITSGFLPLLLVFLISASLAFSFAEVTWVGYVQSSANASFIYGSLLIILPYISLSAVLFLIASRATGLPEITVFLFSVWLLCWSIPPVLGALQDTEIQNKTSPVIIMIIKGTNQLLPSLSSSEISLRLAHSYQLQPVQVIGYISHHLAYALLAMFLAIMLFNRRDLI